jgi:hypothetical protein
MSVQWVGYVRNRAHEHPALSHKFIYQEDFAAGLDECKNSLFTVHNRDSRCWQGTFLISRVRTSETESTFTMLQFQVRADLW